MSKFKPSATIRSLAELSARYKETFTNNPLVRDIERLEYSRMMSFQTAKKLGANGDIETENDWAKDDVNEIDHSAKTLLRLWETRITLGDSRGSLRFTQMFVAFKWMLGHEDSDMLPGAFADTCERFNSDAFKLVREQIVTGEWDRLTDEAMQRAEVIKLEMYKKKAPQHYARLMAAKERQAA